MNLLAVTETEYYAQTFKDLSYQNEAIVSKEFDECVFSHCSFRETIFRNCKFRDCIFKGSDLSLAQVKDCSFVTSKFEDSQIIGLNWTEASWKSKGFFKTIDFFDCVINYSTFFGLALREMNLTGCVAKEVDFAEADLSQANCRNTDFEKSRFLNTNLTGADFTGAINYSIAATLNTMKKTKFSLPEAISLLYSLDIILSE